jgi:hypothetical protein
MAARSRGARETNGFRGVRSIGWVKEGAVGLEFADVELSDRRMKASGVAIGSGPMPYRLDYRFESRSRFITESIEVVSRGQGWRRSLLLERDKIGEWDASWETHGEALLPPPTGDMKDLAEAFDCDLAISPLTNTMPVLRHDLLRGGGPVEFLMAWISVPDLSVIPSRQRYTFVRADELISVVRYESSSRDFVAEIVFDEDGLVVEYPGIGHRLS